MFQGYFQQLNNLNESYPLEEVFETHDQLNPQLFQDNYLKPEIRKQLIKIADEFVSHLKEDNIPLDVIDYWLLGSNAAYNYSSKSDIDVHIIVNMEDLGVDPYILQVLYNYIKSDFNKKYDIEVKGHEVELYIEDVRSGAVTNGIYSLLKDKWVKEPIRTEYMYFDVTETDEYKEWLDRYESLPENEIEQFINDLFIMRKESLAKDGEWSVGNLIFKEFRNRGYLDSLKDRKYKYRSKELTLEGLNEKLLKEATTRQLQSFAQIVKKELNDKNLICKPHQSHTCVDIFKENKLIGQAYPKFEKLDKRFYTLINIKDKSEIQPEDIIIVKRLKDGVKPEIIGVDFIKNVHNVAYTIDEFKRSII